MRSTRFVFLSACLGMLLFGISFITLGSVAPALSARFGLSGIEAGTLFTVLPFGILAGSLLFGPIADRYGYKVVLVVACLLMFAGFQGIAWATDRAILNGCIFLFGFSGGVINGASNASVADVSVAKSANISLIGVFYAIGALGMPFVLGAFGDEVAFENIVSFVGYFTLVAAVVFGFTRFPPPKISSEMSFFQGFRLLTQPALLLIGFFLFCQSAFEGMVNNWSTTFLTREVSLSGANALYALSLYVVGMAIMRLLIGGVLRNVAPMRILIASFGLLAAGTIVLYLSGSFLTSAIAMVVLGGGLAAGFPVMLGLAGELYQNVSGTAFSIVLTIALFGNMAFNFLMGVIVERWGVEHLITMYAVLLVGMVVLTLNIIGKITRKLYAGETMA